MGTPTDDVINQLKDFGSKTGEFIQLEQGKTLKPGQVDKGFCTGVCVDWARRVLGGGRAAFTLKEARKVSQTNRQATVHLNLKAMNNTRNAIVGVRNQLVDVYNSQTGQKCQISLQLQQGLLTYITFPVEANRQYERTFVGQWLDLLAEMRDESDRTTSAGWAAFVGIMDEKHRVNRGNQARGESTRKFSSIKILKSEKAVGGANVKAKIDSMLLLNEFDPGTVLLMGFDLIANGEDTGHAVAAYQLNNGTYQFLDPNYGIYAYNQGGLRSALYYLFTNHYGTPIYGEDGDVVTGGADYILFGPV